MILEEDITIVNGADAMLPPQKILHWANFTSTERKLEHGENSVQLPRAFAVNTEAELTLS